MAEYTKTLEEELAEQGIIGSYIWKPNTFFAKKGNKYVSVDTVSDGSAEEVARTVYEAGNTQLSEIRALATEQKALIAANEKEYTAVKNSLIQTYRRMYNYFVNQELYALATVMATAIVNLNQM
jgi:RPA family protein